MHNYMEKYAKELTPWKITAGITKEYGACIHAFEKQIPLPQQNVQKRNEDIKRVAGMMHELYARLKVLDKLVHTARKTFPDFAEIYVKHRRIVKPYTLRYALIGEVRDADTNEPIPGIRVTLSYDGRTYVVTEKGGLFIRNIKAGTHSLTFQHPDYVVITLPIEVTARETLRQTFLLKRIR